MAKKEYIADKDTLDSVDSKVGASSDAAASSAPTTLFSGIKGILSLLSELKNLLSDGKTLGCQCHHCKRSYNGGKRGLCNHGNEYRENIYLSHRYCRRYGYSSADFIRQDSVCQRNENNGDNPK